MISREYDACFAGTYKTNSEAGFRSHIVREGGRSVEEGLTGARDINMKDLAIGGQLLPTVRRSKSL